MVQAVALREVAPPQPRWEVGLMAGQGFLEICDPTSDCSAFLCSEGIVTKSFFVYNPNKLCSQPSLNKVFFMYVCTYVMYVFYCNHTMLHSLTATKKRS